MITYKLFRVKNGKLYPLYVLADKETPVGVEIKAEVGQIADETHVKSKLGHLSLRPGWHSTHVPFTDWIGKRADDGTLLQKKNTVWCECEVNGKEQVVTERHGLRHLPRGWYHFKTNSKQREPWVISDNLKVVRVLSDKEVATICKANGYEPQRKEM